MNLAVMRKTRSETLIDSTWCILLRGKDEILLAMKKRGFGAGKWNCPGGKAEKGEPVDVCAARETDEEVGIRVRNLGLVAVVEFYFLNRPDWGQRVHGFVTREWDGVPRPTEEMTPAWFKFDEIPYTEMWSDDHIWLPQVLAGKKVTGAFLFGDNNDILEYELEEVRK